VRGILVATAFVVAALLLAVADVLVDRRVHCADRAARSASEERVAA
jgi:hypothetical protein